MSSGLRAASETNVIESRVVDGNSSVGADASLEAADAGGAVATIVSPVTASVADAVDLAAVGAAETDVVDGRVVGRVAIGANSQLEGDWI